MLIGLKIMVAMLGLTALGAIAQSPVPKPPSPDKALRARFFAHHADFEKLVAMANEDSRLTRIAPDFTWLDDDVAWPRSNVGISEQRWAEYRQIFRRIGVMEGILKYTNPTLIMFPIMSVGLVPSGSAKGIAYSEAPLSPALKSLDQRPPDEFWNGPDRSHVLVYKQITAHWYIYFQQW